MFDVILFTYHHQLRLTQHFRKEGMILALSLKKFIESVLGNLYRAAELLFGRLKRSHDLPIAEVFTDQHDVNIAAGAVTALSYRPVYEGEFDL